MGAVLKAGQALFGFHMRMTPVTRARNYLYGLLTAKDPAKEVRAFGIGPYLTARHAALYDEHMTELRRTTRHRFRIAVAGTLGLAVALGAGIAGLLFPRPFEPSRAGRGRHRRVRAAHPGRTHHDDGQQRRRGLRSRAVRRGLGLRCSY
jgi:hypothetical protein